MDNGQILAAWRTHGFVILPGFLTAAELAPAQAGLEQMFPRAERFHDHSDPRSSRFAEDDSLSHEPAWDEFVAQALPGQLALVGFPPPGHAFWAPETAAAMGPRYPGTDWAAWLRP